MEQKQNKDGLVPSTRLGMTVLWFYGAVSMYMIRANFGISIVCMTVDNNTMTNDTTSNSSTPDDQCGDINEETEQTGEFVWDRKTRGLLNSAVFFGYILTQVPSGILAHKLGAKWVHVGGLAFAAVMSFLGPISAELSEWGLFTTRVLLGVGCGAYVSPVRGMLVNWAPIGEKSTLYSLQSSGYAVGSVVVFSLTGFLCSTLGWTSTFYIPSLFMVLYVLLFIIFGTDTPEDARFISEKEKSYIILERTPTSDQTLEIPWKSIFTSVPCWTIFICDFCGAWGSYTVLTSGAQYMYDVLKFDIAANGGYNALPHLCTFVCANLSGILFDAFYRRSRGRISKTNIRKIAQSIGFLTPAAMMIGMSFMDCERRGAAIAMLCLAMGGQASVNSGMFTNALEVAPEFVPVIGGITNAFAQAAGMVAPIVAGVLVPNGKQEEWARVFYLGTGLYLFGWLLYMVFADAEVQSWAVNRQNETFSDNSCTDSDVKDKHYLAAGTWNVGSDLADTPGLNVDTVKTHL